MKRTTFLLLLLFATYCVSGQRNSTIFHDPDKTNDVNHGSRESGIFHRSAGIKSMQETYQKLDSMEYSSWDDVNSQWQPWWLNRFTYNDDGHIIRNLLLEWDGSGMQYQMGWKEDYEYDNLSNMILRTEFMWDLQSNEWITLEKTENSYNAEGLLIQDMFYEYSDANQWELVSKAEYNYNSSGDLILMISSDWIQSTNEWLNVWMCEYTYEDENLIMSLDHTWDPGTSQWDVIWKHEYIYNNGLMTEEYDHEWYDDTGQWVPVYMYEYFYDTEHNLSEEYSYYWVEATEEWMPEEKNIYAFNNDYTFSELLLPYFVLYEDQGLFNHMLVSYVTYFWDTESNAFVDGYKVDLYFSEQNIGRINENIEKMAAIFPNPASDIINLSIGESHEQLTLKLFDACGNIVMLTEVSDGTKLNISMLRSGVFFYHLIRDDGWKQSGKLLKY